MQDQDQRGGWWSHGGLQRGKRVSPREDKTVV